MLYEDGQMENYIVEQVAELDKEIWEEYENNVLPEERYTFPYRYYLLLKLSEIRERGFNEMIERNLSE